MTNPNDPARPTPTPEPGSGADPQAIKDAVGAGEKKPTAPGAAMPATGKTGGETLSTLSEATTSGDGTTTEEGGDELARDPVKSSIGNIR